MIVTGGVDKTAVIYNKNTQKKEATLSGHSKPVVAVKFHPEVTTVVYTASTDATAKMWYFEPEKSDWNSHTVKVHTNAVNGLDVHCTGDLFVTASADRTWALHDARQGRSLYRCVSEKVEAGLTAVRFHPDGIIMATGGDDNVVNVWDTRTGKAPKAQLQGHTGGITSVAFSENGYFMASAGQDRTIFLWDLRAPKKLQSIALEEVPASLTYDYSGKYLAAAVGTEVRYVLMSYPASSLGETSRLLFPDTCPTQQALQLASFPVADG
jgi:pre-mRNA-processing factor 19